MVGVNFGYSRNNGLNIEGSTPSNQTYNYWFGGATLESSVGPDAEFKSFVSSAVSGFECFVLRRPHVRNKRATASHYHLVWDGTKQPIPI